MRKLGMAYSYLHAAACASLPLFTMSKSEPASTDLFRGWPRQTVRHGSVRTARTLYMHVAAADVNRIKPVYRDKVTIFPKRPSTVVTKGRILSRCGVRIRRYAAASRAARRRASAPTTRRRYFGATVVVFIGLAWVRTVSRSLSSASSSSDLPAKSPVPLIICG